MRIITALMLAGLLGLIASPVLAAEPSACKSPSASGARMAFPNGDQNDVPTARALVPAVELGFALKAALPACSRGRVATGEGEMLLGGEDSDTLPRTAARSDGKPGYLAFVAKAPQDTASPATYILGLVWPNGTVSAQRLYQGVPSDQILLEDIRQSVSESNYLVALRRGPSQGSSVPITQVSYGFSPPGGVLPPVQNSVASDGSQVIAGPQVRMNTDASKYLEPAVDGFRHHASGFVCPFHLDGDVLTLSTLETADDLIKCSYREGSSPTYQPDAQIKYTVMMFKDDEPPARLMADIAASARKALSIRQDKAAPLAVGRAPAPQQAAFWTLKDDTVEGLWLGQSKSWMLRVQVDYAASPANDAQAARIAQLLYGKLFGAPARP